MRYKKLGMVLQQCKALLPVASAMNSDITKERVGSHFGSIPFVIITEKRRSAPTATMIAPEAQAKVNTINAGTKRMEKVRSMQ